MESFREAEDSEQSDFITGCPLLHGDILLFCLINPQKNSSPNIRVKLNSFKTKEIPTLNGDLKNEELTISLTFTRVSFLLLSFLLPFLS